MRLRAFHVGDGDCILLSGDDHHILVDGGRKTAFRANARDEIYNLDTIDLVCVSHIDDDHISGVLGIIEDTVDWRVHRRRSATGKPTTEPSFPEPPAIGEIWHNSLFELVGDELEPKIEASLAGTAAAFAGSRDAGLSEHAAWCDNLASGERSSMELSRRISDAQLGIDRNRPRNQLMDVDNSAYRRIGPFTIRIVGPTAEALQDLEARWRRWLDDNEAMLKRLQAEMLRDEERLGGLTAARPGVARIATALGEGTITEPNLASLMLLVQDTSGSRVLLTGDGSSEDILNGLAHYDKLDDHGRIHVDGLKIQHHGAEANVTPDFVERVTADHYLFCGNGAHHNPERSVVRALAEARLGVGREAAGPDGSFTFWFTSSANTPGLSDNRVAHMADIEQLTDEIASNHDPDGRFQRRFLDHGFFDIDL